jgi:exosortase A-associated hydrolase 2
MTETPRFFTGPSGNLFGVLHTGAARRLPFVFCHPFGEEKLWTHRVHVNFARELARRGHTVLRFDYAGSGDSDGAVEDASIESALQDIAAAIDLVKAETGAPTVALLGLRSGASLACVTAERRTDVERLVLWAPIVDGAKHLQELLRVNLTTQMAVYREIRDDRPALLARLAAGELVNVDGYELSRAFTDGLQALDLASGAAVDRDCLIVQIERSAAARPSAEGQALASRFPRGELRVVQEEPFWKEIPRFYDTAPNLWQATLDWMTRHDG